MSVFVHKLRRYALPITVVIICLPALATLLVLGRFPPYMDEALFNYTAARCVLGKPMPWRVSCDAPYWDLTWAYHGPFYPMLQAVIFHLFGVSSFTSRMSNFFAANAAILMLCIFLIRNHFNLAAIALAAAWVGDRAYRESQLGRMEGIALLTVSIAFLFLMRALSRGRTRDIALASMTLGFGAGFQPTLLVLFPVVVLAIILRRRHCFQNISAAAAGLCIPVAVVALLYWGTWYEALTQFRWHAALARSTLVSSRLYWFDWSLGWSRMWVYGLALGILLILIPSLLMMLRRAWITQDCDLSCAMVVIPAGFAIFAVLSRPLQQYHVYHLVLVTPWAILALIAVSNAKIVWLSKCARFWLVGLAIAWFPSAAENARLLRAMFVEFDALNPTLVVRDLQSNLPAGALVDVHYDYYIPACQARLNFDVPWWYPCAEQFDDGRWLVLPLGLWEERNREFAGRPYTVHERYGPSRWFKAQYVIVGPRSSH